MKTDWKGYQGPDEVGPWKTCKGVWILFQGSQKVFKGLETESDVTSSCFRRTASELQGALILQIGEGGGLNQGIESQFDVSVKQIC